MKKVGSMESVPEVPQSPTKKSERAPFNYYSKMPKNANKSFRFDKKNQNDKDKKDLDLDEIVSKSDFSSDESEITVSRQKKLRQS